MFEAVHIFAVLGTACFMMALATVWYSQMLFGKMWMREAKVTPQMIEDAQPRLYTHMFLTFCSYVVMLTLLSFLVAYAPLLSISPLQAAGLLSVFVAAGAVAPTLFEGKSIYYYFIRIGFYILFVVLGTAILQYWPW